MTAKEETRRRRGRRQLRLGVVMRLSECAIRLFAGRGPGGDGDLRRPCSVRLGYGGSGRLRTGGVCHPAGRGAGLPVLPGISGRAAVHRGGHDDLRRSHGPV